MNTIKAFTLSAILATVSGCATCEHHPVACTAAAVVIGTSIALSARHTNDPPSKAACESSPSFPNGCHPIG